MDNNQKFSTVCPHCLNNSLKFRREETGSKHDRKAKTRQVTYRTLAYCKQCGFTFDATNRRQVRWANNHKKKQDAKYKRLVQKQTHPIWYYGKNILLIAVILFVIFVIANLK